MAKETKKAKKGDELKSKKHQIASKVVDAEKVYTLDEALDLVKKSSYTKFDGTVELHINLDIDIKKPDQTLRTTTSLPHGTGKTLKVAAFSAVEVKGADLSLNEEGIAQIEQNKIKPGIDFEAVCADPSFMPKLTKIARILGPRGMMPNPKTGTVSTDLVKVVAELKKGKVELRNEANAPIIHTKIGKVSFSKEALVENYNEIFKTLRANRPQKAGTGWIKSAFIASTMGPSIQVAIEA